MNGEARSPETGSEYLIHSILSEAEAEAKSIVDAAKADAAKRREALERRLESIESDAEKRIGRRTQQLTARAAASMELAKRRSQLRLEQRIYRVAERRAAAGLEELRGTTEYGPVLRGWITEAAIGLGERHAIVRAPAPDRSTVEHELAAAQTAIRDESEFDVVLSIGDALPSGQGVVLTSADASVAFDNTVAARLRRFAPEVRRIVYRAVVEPEDHNE